MRGREEFVAEEEAGKEPETPFGFKFLGELNAAVPAASQRRTPSSVRLATPGRCARSGLRYRTTAGREHAVEQGGSGGASGRVAFIGGIGFRLAPGAGPEPTD
jgi:hypothetical protein